MAKRGRPLGKKNKKRRGRPIGSKNKIMNITPIIKVRVKCIICKRHYQVRTDKKDLHLFTSEVKKNWVCCICKVNELVEIKDRNGKIITLKAKTIKIKIGNILKKLKRITK